MPTVPIGGSGLAQVADRVYETTTTTGTGTLTLGGAVVGYQSFAAVGDGNHCCYAISDVANDAWEVGIGTYTASGTTLSRDTILASSNSGSAVNLQAGLKSVFLTIPASQFEAIPYPVADHHADAGSVGTGETDLYSDTTAAGILAINGDQLRFEYAITLVNSVAPKEVRVYFGGTAIFDTGSLTTSGAGQLSITGTIIRDSSTSVRYRVTGVASDVSSADFISVGKLTGLTLSGTNVLKITGQSSGISAANDDVLAIDGAVVKVPGV